MDIQLSASDFECGICREVTVNPYVTTCGHFFCIPCVQTWVRSTYSPSCPVCRTSIQSSSIKPNSFLERLLQDQRIATCTHCDEKFTPNELKVHCQKCPKNITNCNYCSQKFPVTELSEHWKTCELVTEECNQCHSLILKKLIDDHKLERCPHRMNSCLLCDARIPISRLNTHIQFECLAHIVHCHQCGQQHSALDHAACTALKIQTNRYCHQCKGIVKDPASLVQHLKLNCVHRLTPCPRCDEKVKVCDLPIHARTQCVFNQCEFCDQVFKRGTELETHKGECEFAESRCANCNLRGTRLEIRQHVGSAICSIQKRTPCSKCGTTDIKFANLEAHQNECDGTRPCYVCKKKVAVTEFVSHVSNCDEGEVKCVLCETSISFKTIDEHMESRHTGYRKCARCSVFVPASQWTMHNEVVCPTAFVRCTQCSRSFPREKIVEHRQHAHKHPYWCAEIGCTYTSFREDKTQEHVVVGNQFHRRLRKSIMEPVVHVGRNWMELTSMMNLLHHPIPTPHQVVVAKATEDKFPHELLNLAYIF